MPVIEFQTDLIKPLSEGGFAGVISEYGEVITGYTSLIKYMPPQVKMSNCHKMMCGCEICIYASMMHFD